MLRIVTVAVSRAAVAWRFRHDGWVHREIYRFYCHTSTIPVVIQMKSLSYRHPVGSYRAVTGIDETRCGSRHNTRFQNTRLRFAEYFHYFWSSDLLLSSPPLRFRRSSFVSVPCVWHVTPHWWTSWNGCNRVMVHVTHFSISMRFAQ